MQFRQTVEALKYFLGLSEKLLLRYKLHFSILFNFHLACAIKSQYFPYLYFRREKGVILACKFA